MNSMQDEYSWNGGRGGSSSFRLPQNEGQGKWVLIAIVLAVLVHVGLFIGLGKIDIELPEFVAKKEIRTQVVRVSPVDTTDARPEIIPPDQPEIEEPVAVVPPADELDILESLPEMEIDISPDIETIQVPKISSAAIGELEENLKSLCRLLSLTPNFQKWGKRTIFSNARTIAK